MEAMAFHATLREKWDSIMSCYRLSTESQAALTRSLRDFAGVASQVPGLEGVFTDGVLAAAAAAAADPRGATLLDPTEEDLVDEDGLIALDGTGGKRKKMKKEKDPNLPKRPPTSYLMYANDVMQEVRSQMQPGSPVGEMMKNIAAKWKVLDEHTKGAYNQRYQMALEDWRARVADYRAQKGPEGARSDDEAAAAAIQNASGHGTGVDGTGLAPAQKKKPGRKPKNALQQQDPHLQQQTPQPQHHQQHHHQQHHQHHQQTSPAMHHGLHNFNQSVLPGLHHAHHNHFSNLPYGSSPQMSQLPEASTLATLEKKQRKRKAKD